MESQCSHVFTDENGRVPARVMVIGLLGTNCYLISDGEGPGTPAMVVDPAGDADAILEQVGQHELRYIVCTHNHFDHVGAVAELARRTNAQVVASVQDAPKIEAGQQGSLVGIDYCVEPAAVDVRLEDGDVLELGSLAFKAIHTPGHTKGGMCFWLEGADGRFGMLFSGDTLFYGGTGRTDLEGGNAYELRASLRTKLAALPNETVVYPGHGGFTTIGAERRRTLETF